METIYRTYNDTEVVQLAVNVECPYCGNGFQVIGVDDCGKTYEITCDKFWNVGCGKVFKMHFDAN